MSKRSEWLKRVQPTLTRLQRFREKREIEELRRALPSRIPERPAILEQEPPGRSSGFYAAKYKKVLHGQWCYIFQNVRESSLVEFVECIWYCIEWTKLLNCREDDKEERQAKLESFKKSARAEVVFPDTKNLVAEILAVCAPTRWEPPLFENPNTAGWYVTEKEALDLFRELDRFLERSEEHSKERESNGSAFVSLHADMVEWLIETKRKEKKKALDDGAMYGPLMWEVNRELYFNVPGLRIELINIVRWSHRAGYLRRARDASRRYEEKLAQVKQRNESYIQHFLEKKYASYFIVRDGEREIARSRPELAEGTTIVAKGPEFRSKKTKETKPIESVEMVEYFDEIQHLSSVPPTFTLGTDATRRLMTSNTWFSDDVIFFFLKRVLALQLMEKKIKNLCFIAPPFGVVRISKRRQLTERNEGPLAQDVMKRKDGMMVAVLCSGGNHWVTVYAYRDLRADPAVIVFDSLSPSGSSSVISPSTAQATRAFCKQVDGTLCEGRNCGLVRGNHHASCKKQNGSWVNAPLVCATGWSFQDDNFNCGPFAIKAAALALDIPYKDLPPAAAPFDHDEVTRFRSKLPSENPGAHIRMSLQQEFLAWEKMF